MHVRTHRSDWKKTKNSQNVHKIVHKKREQSHEKITTTEKKSQHKFLFFIFVDQENVQKFVHERERFFFMPLYFLLKFECPQMLASSPDVILFQSNLNLIA